MCLSLCHTHWLRAQYDKALVLLTHNDNTPHAVPSIGATCRQIHALLMFHYPHTGLRIQIQTHSEHKDNKTVTKQHAFTQWHGQAVTNNTGMEQKAHNRVVMVSEETNRCVMGLTGGVKGRWRLLNMNNEKRPSSRLPFWLTSIKTSPTLWAQEFHLHGNRQKHQQSVKKSKIFYCNINKIKTCTNWLWLWNGCRIFLYTKD